MVLRCQHPLHLKSSKVLLQDSILLNPIVGQMAYVLGALISLRT
ncbi:hypothetical protein PDIG_22290 [Penicillium digitatum PHI26]|uniref:Uncharacterized protein n=2 Tax=Penicillium digitatum TaxID=36651 RepID=K9GN16_PEND2|nr:hypothetical protein PDIP_24570 [Penicillium digitatum Pd1]EKV16103.1 hypothetical protein PDIG_22290 [Penicillium digitatum PHI26]EKV19298.1 hypothetical protein PDIP_24570 [Penicillium digitatum Pd1]